MSDDAVICPDCGGFIGLEPGDTRTPCRCLSEGSETSARPSSAGPTATLNPTVARLMQQAEAASRNKMPPVEATRLQPKADGANGSADGSSASNGDSAGGASAETASGPRKLCRVCGKDLAGHRRLKDSLGYICRECAKLEAQPEDPTRRPCPECGKKIKPAGFVPYNGKHICRKCFADHMELDKYKKAAPSAATFVKQEKQQLGRLLIFAAILGLLMLYSAYLHFWKH